MLPPDFIPQPIITHYISNGKTMRTDESDSYKPQMGGAPPAVLAFFADKFFPPHIRKYCSDSAIRKFYQDADLSSNAFLAGKC